MQWFALDLSRCVLDSAVLCTFCSPIIIIIIIIMSEILAFSGIKLYISYHFLLWTQFQQNCSKSYWTWLLHYIKLRSTLNIHPKIGQLLAKLPFIFFNYTRNCFDWIPKRRAVCNLPGGSRVGPLEKMTQDLLHLDPNVTAEPTIELHEEKLNQNYDNIVSENCLLWVSQCVGVAPVWR